MEDVKKLIEEIGTLNKEFQAKANQEFAEIKAKQSTVISKDELDKMGARLGELEESKNRVDAIDKKLARLEAFGGGKDNSNDARNQKHRGEFMGYIRKKMVSDDLKELDCGFKTDRVWNKLSQKEQDIYGPMRHKDIQVGVSEDGGFLVPEIIESEIYDLIREQTVMRSVCDVVTVSSDDYKQYVNAHGATAAWRGETQAVAETSTPTLHEVSAIMGELSAMPITTQKALDDISTDVQGWLAREVALAFAEAENDKFTDGTGIFSPKGFLDYTSVTTADATRAFGQLQHVISGAAADFATASATVSPADAFLNVIGETKPAIADGAIWMANRATITSMRKFKNAVEGGFVWQQSLLVGAPSTFLGYPVVENYDMPAVGANTYPVAFGNFKRGYRIVDRLGVRMIRDDITTKGYVKFWTSKRVGGMVFDSNAIKLIKMSA